MTTASSQIRRRLNERLLESRTGCHRKEGRPRRPLSIFELELLENKLRRGLREEKGLGSFKLSDALRLGRFQPSSASQFLVHPLRHKKRRTMILQYMDRAIRASLGMRAISRGSAV